MYRIASSAAYKLVLNPWKGENSPDPWVGSRTKYRMCSDAASYWILFVKSGIYSQLVF